MHKSPTPRPARPEKLGFRFTRDDEGLAIVYSIRGKSGGVFMLLWLTAWTVGCIVLLGMVINDPKLFNILFAVPFWTGEIFVFIMMLRAFFGREYFLLNRSGALFIRRVFIPIKTRSVPLEEIKFFQECVINRNSESGYITKGVEMLTLGQSLYFIEEITPAESDWLIDQLNDFLSSTRDASNASVEGMSNSTAIEDPNSVSVQPSDADEEKPIDNASGKQILQLSKNPREPPSDCRWEWIDDFDSTTFLQRGRILWAVLGGFLFATLFCNGIVSVFILNLWGFMPGQQPKGGEWWFTFFFLIPFEVIGLCIFLGLLYQLFEPYRRTRWKFDNQNIECRWTWFGLGPRWLYSLRPLSRLELQSSSPNKTSPGEKSQDIVDIINEGANRSLVFIDRENVELCSIKRLTEGEARWIGDFILRERSYWFE
jgi:hypothetical protein